MTSIQTLANAFADIRLEAPEAVVVDAAAAHVWRLHDAAEPHDRYDDLAVPDRGELRATPDFLRRGVCTYTPDSGELLLFAGFEHERLDGPAADELRDLLAGRIDAVRELSVAVDAFNEIEARVPPRATCEALPFGAFERRIDYGDAGVVDLGGADADKEERPVRRR